MVLVVAPLRAAGAADAARAALRCTRGNGHHEPPDEAEAVQQHKVGDGDPQQVAHVGQRAQVDAEAAPPRPRQQLLGCGEGGGMGGRSAPC